MDGREIRSPDIPEETLNQIASDNTSGAAEILRQAGEAFVQLNASAARCSNLAQTQQAILDTCTGLVSAQPEMTPILRLASTALSAALTSREPRDALKCAERAALNFIENAERAAQQASKASVGLIQYGARVLTHSRSSTVLAALVEARRRGIDFSAVVTESRPMLEGRALAASLAAQDIPVNLIADAAASLAMEEVDLVIIGADTITPMNLINKIGTRMITLAARARRLPIFAVCDSSKFLSDDSFSSASRAMSRAELWPDAPPGVVVINRYFEKTPLDWFNGVVMEDGVLTAAEAGCRAEQTTIDIALTDALRASLDGIK